MSLKAIAAENTNLPTKRGVLSAPFFRFRAMYSLVLSIPGAGVPSISMRTLRSSAQSIAGWSGFVRLRQTLIQG